MNKKLQAILSILAGIITNGMVGWLLLMVLLKVFSSGSELLFTSPKLGNIVFNSTFFLWVGITSFCGGFVTAIIAPGRNIFYAMMTGVISFVAITGFTFFVHTGLGFNTLLPVLSIIIFSLMGGLVQQKIALSRYETV